MAIVMGAVNATTAELLAVAIRVPHTWAGKTPTADEQVAQDIASSSVSRG